MTQSRRGFLKQLTTIATVSGSVLLAGCNSTGNDLPQTNSDIGSQSGVDSVTKPVPIIQSQGKPDPIISTTDTKTATNQNTEFVVTFWNNGVEGDVSVSLNWINGFDDGEPSSSEFQERKTTTLAKNEEYTMNFTASPPDNRGGSWFIAEPASIRGTIKNTGAEGDISVTLFKDGSPFDTKEIRLSSSEVTDILFSAPLYEEGVWQLSADSAE